MRGTIKGSKPYARTYFFIHGEDGTDYFTNCHFVQGKKIWRYCWDGNGVTFEVAPVYAEGKKPTAINVVPDPVIDPNWGLKAARRRKAKAEHERNLVKKQEKARINAIREADLERLREVKRKYLWYVVEWRDGGEWVELYTSDGPCRFRELSYAKAFSQMMGDASPRTRFRVVKRYIAEGGEV